MKLRDCAALLVLWWAACATPAPRAYAQAAIPIGPLVAPKPVALPVPAALPPPVPLVVHPEEQVGTPARDSRESPQPTHATPEAQTPEPSGPSANPQPESDNHSSRKDPPPVAARQHRSECRPVPVPHLGGDERHNKCADEFPPNRFPGHDVRVDGKRFDALQVGAPVLWEIKTDNFDTYSPFLRRQVVSKQILELQRERELALACGYQFIVGVSSATHRAALLKEAPRLVIVLTGC